jgi:hypothetical protein
VIEAAVTVSLVAAVAPLAVLGARYHHAIQQARLRKTFSISFPRGVDPQAVESFVRGLAGLQPPRWRRPFALPVVLFTIEADDREVAFSVSVEPGTADFIQAQLRSAIPSAALTETSPRTGDDLETAAELRLSNAYRQLAVEHPSDFAAGLLSALRPLGDGERIKLQWALSPAASPGPVRQNPILQRLAGSQTVRPPRRDKPAGSKE